MGSCFIPFLQQEGYLIYKLLFGRANISVFGAQSQKRRGLKIVSRYEITV